VDFFLRQNGTGLVTFKSNQPTITLFHIRKLIILLIAQSQPHKAEPNLYELPVPEVSNSAILFTVK
jgi:hypothetical protein